MGDSITAGGGSSDNNRKRSYYKTLKVMSLDASDWGKCWASLLKRHIEENFPQSQVINNGCSDITSTHVKDHLLQLLNDADDRKAIMINSSRQKASKQVDGIKVEIFPTRNTV